MFKKNKIRNIILLFSIIRKVCPFRIVIGLVAVLLEKTTSIIFSVLLIKYIINNYNNNLSLYNIITTFLLCGVFLVVTRIISSYYYNVYLPISNVKIEDFVKTKIYDKAKEIDLKYYDSPDLYEKFSLAMSDSSARIIELYEAIISLFGSLYMVITIGMIMVIIQPIFLIFVLLPLFINMLIGNKFNLSYYKYNNEKILNQRVRDYVNRCFYYKEYLLDQKTTQISNALFNFFKDSTLDLLRIIRTNSKKIGFFEYVYMVTSDVVVYLGCMLFCVLSYFSFKAMTISDCIVIINTLNNMIGALWQIGSIYIKIDRNIIFLDNYVEFLNLPVNVVGGEKLLTQNKDIVFKEVTFQYPNSARLIFEKLTFNIKYGQKVAIVGVNGVGKTTLIKLLLRLYDPIAGEILCGNENIKNYDIGCYRNSYGAIFQDFQIYAFSVANNISMRSQYNNEDIFDSLNKSGLDTKLSQYDGYLNRLITNDTDEDGIQLSKGEAQKLALSRIFYKNPFFIILDEPFSNLDLLAEKKIYHNLTSVFKEKTIIVISHKLASVADFDKIIVIDNGYVLESGTHDQLMKFNGQYSRMFNEQASSYL